MVIASFKKLDKVWKFFAPFFVILLAADQLSKAWALKALSVGEKTDFGFSLSYNDGVVFGLDLPIWAIYVLTLIVFGLAVWLVVENKLWRDKWHLTGLALLFSGAIGNVVDRVRFGYVVDFIKVYWWPTFNLADVFIVAAVVLFAWEFLIREEGVSKI